MRRSSVCCIQLKTTKCKQIKPSIYIGKEARHLFTVVLPPILLTAELLCRYGYLTNTKVKFIMVTTDLDVRDADVRNVSLMMYRWLPSLLNPFCRFCRLNRILSHGKGCS